ncbi:MAG: hypothetical protein Salg2KO_16740 [Salibacteraceae bacterium]
MLYQLLRPLITAGIKAYFKRVSITGGSHLEGDRVLFVCNHPSALFDPVLIAISTRKPLHFLAGAEWFGKGFQRWLFQRQFNMIPVYRPWLAHEGAKEKVSNEDMFRACYESLAAKKRIIIFPEASSVTVPWIRDIKTGAARIKIGADKHDPKQEPVKIVPIGINYTNPHRFQTSVLIKVGDPIDFKDLEQSIDDEKMLVQAMTTRIKEEMSNCLSYNENEDALSFIKDVKKIMTDTLKSELGVAEGDVDKEFIIRKSIVDEIELKLKQDPDSTLEIARELRAYIERYESYGFRQYNPFQEKVWVFIMKLVALIIGAPFFFIGAIINFIPFVITRWVYQHFFLPKVTVKDAQGQLNSAFAGSLGFIAGLVVFLVWYALLWILVSMAIPWWISAIALVFLGYTCGQFAMLYYKWWVQCRKFIRWQRYRISRPNEMRALLQERHRLISDLLSLRKDR